MTKVNLNQVAFPYYKNIKNDSEIMKEFNNEYHKATEL